MWLKLLLGDVETDSEDIGDCGTTKPLRASKRMRRISVSSSVGERLRLGGASSKAKRLDGSREFAVGLIGVPPT